VMMFFFQNTLLVTFEMVMWETDDNKYSVFGDYHTGGIRVRML
jgi:hypothetical protein